MWRSVWRSVVPTTSGGVPNGATAASVAAVATGSMAQLHDLRLRLLVQQESERIVDTLPDGLDLSVIQARCLCWLALLAEAHEDSANDAVAEGDTDQAMAWFADSMRLRDVIQVVSSIEIPIPGASDDDDTDANENGPLAA